MIMNTMKITSIISIILISMYVFPSSVRTFILVNKVNYEAITESGIAGLFNRLQRPHEGEIALPKEVQVMVGILRSQKITTFRYSKAINDMELGSQRLVEGAYPIKVSASSHYLILLSNEKLPPFATVIIEAEGVILAYCP